MRVSWMKVTGLLSLEKARLKGLLTTIVMSTVMTMVRRPARPSAVLLVLLAVGCADTGALRIPVLTDVDVPVWVVKGSGTFGSGVTGVFHGVSSAQGISNPDILRASADRRARGELRVIIKAYAVMMAGQYYSEKAGPGSGVAIPDEKRLAKTYSVITRSAIKTSTILERWQNPKNREQYSLATIEVADFIASLDRVSVLDKGLMAFMRKNAVRLLRDFKGRVRAPKGPRAGK